VELRLNERHIIAANFLLIAVLAYVAALAVNDLIGQLISGAPAGGGEVVTAVTPASRVNHPRAFYDQIVRRDIFNVTPQLETEHVPTAEDLGVKLLGTSQLTLAKPFAIIEGRDGNQTLYQLGEEIPDAGQLVKVEQNRVLVNHDGRVVALELPNANVAGGAVSRGEPAVSLPTRLRRGHAGIERPAPAPAPKPADDKLSLKKLGPRHFALNRADLQQKMRDPGPLMTDMRAVPVMADGKPTGGYTLSEIVPNSAFAQAGLRNGDVVTEVNDQPLGAPLEALSRLGTAAGASNVDLTVMRGGAPVHIRFDIR
jgi:type II secretion system protein C